MYEYCITDKLGTSLLSTASMG